MDVASEKSHQQQQQYSFTNEHDIGKAVSDWTENYNATHGRTIGDILQIGAMNMIT
jgi:hypothetical protein